MSALISRRAFAFGGAALSFSALTRRTALGAPPSNQQITVHPDVGIATIRPELHGHFAEHLGSCVYGGLWVGADSRIPNINGYRKQRSSTSRNSASRCCAGRAAASRTITTGATGSGRRPSGPSA